ncbi:MAG: CotH kinase family protein [Clostridia bacterium]|nr:CotH kinase family protein [Clostridia bacterium]
MKSKNQSKLIKQTILTGAAFILLSAALFACRPKPEPVTNETLTTAPAETGTPEGTYVDAGTNTPGIPQTDYTAVNPTPDAPSTGTPPITGSVTPVRETEHLVTLPPTSTPFKSPTATHTTVPKRTATAVPTSSPTPKPTEEPAVPGLYPGLPELLITEVLASNDEHPAPDGNFYDYVELYNNSDAPIELSKYYLSDKQTKLQKFRLPAVKLAAGRFTVIYCTGTASAAGAPFKISSSGETIYLSTNGEVCDVVKVPSNMFINESYGRYGDEFVCMSQATPGKQNAPGYNYALAIPEADVPTGAYNNPFVLRLSGEGTVYYTTDGTAPTTSSKKYTKPIHIDGIVSIRAACFDGSKRSRETSFFYVVGIEHTLPIVNVAIRQEYLNGPEGVLNHVDPEYEHVSYVTLLENGAEVFSAPCGFKLHGNDSKLGKKQNFQLRFRSDYGMSKLHCKLFDDRETEVFNSLLLKGGSEDYMYCGFRDELCTTLVDGVTNLDVLACRPVILYLNGQYHGIYFLRERFDQDHFARKLGGVSEDSVNVLRAYGKVEDGDNSDYSRLLNYCRTHDMTKAESLAYVENHVDIYSLIDWYVCRSYMGDNDFANVRFFQSNEADGKWRWCYFDLDWAFWTDRTDCINNVVVTGPNSTLMKLLMTNPVFRDMFIRRYAELMETVLNERTIMEKIDWFVSIMEPEIAQNQARYGLTVERWYERLEKMKDIIRGGRRNITVLRDIRAYFGLSEVQMEEYFGALWYDIDATPMPVTPTPGPTGTPEPTHKPTPGPTGTPEPTHEPTPGPTGTPEPTHEPTPGPSETPEPTQELTPGPSEAPEPTPELTPGPSETPEPTTEVTTEAAPSQTPGPLPTPLPDNVP